MHSEGYLSCSRWHYYASRSTKDRRILIYTVRLVRKLLFSFCQLHSSSLVLQHAAQDNMRFSLGRTLPAGRRAEHFPRIFLELEQSGPWLGLDVLIGRVVGHPNWLSGVICFISGCLFCGSVISGVCVWGGGYYPLENGGGSRICSPCTWCALNIYICGVHATFILISESFLYIY